MLTTITGFPRIGENRELKFALEKYFRHEISFADLSDTASAIRKNNYALMQTNKIDLIPVGDFSLYDNLLDAAVLFNLIPERYADKNLQPHEIYFAMARGHQENGIDLKALPMKKWFNTNYHYIEPEYDGSRDVKLETWFIDPLIKEATALNLNFKVSLIGPFTLLKHIRFVNGTNQKQFAPALTEAYCKLIDYLSQNNVSWAALAEPSLVRDLTPEDIKLFKEIYTAVLEHKKDLKICLETYFGDIRDIYKDVTALDFDCVALDFVEGGKTAELIEKYGFPENRVLAAGLICGKNIWRSNYAGIVGTLQKLEEKGIKTALGTSCSLLHVPMTTARESKLGHDVTRHLAFACEKLNELAEIKSAVNGEEGFEKILEANRSLFEQQRAAPNEKVRERTDSLTESDFVRLPARKERRQIQQKELNLPLFPTTTIGSFPQTQEIRSLRKQLRTNQISPEEYTSQIRRHTAECIVLQEKLGLDVLVHGEFERNDMVEYFGENLDGFIFTENGWVQSYGSRCVKPPVIWSDISRKCPVTVEMSRFAQSCSKKPVKGMLTGPVTILNWSFPRNDISAKTMILQLSLALRDEVKDLEDAGIRIIQIDEAALKEKLPLRKCDQVKEYLEFAIPSFRLLQSSLKPETQIHTHMCYSEFGEIVPWIDAMDADVITFEASRSDFRILDALESCNFETQIGPGVYDIHSPRVPATAEIIEALEKITAKTDFRKVWVNPDCGLKTRGWNETEASLRNMTEAAFIMRKNAAGTNGVKATA